MHRSRRKAWRGVAAGVALMLAPAAGAMLLAIATAAPSRGNWVWNFFLGSPAPGFVGSLEAMGTGSLALVGVILCLGPIVGFPLLLAAAAAVFAEFVCPVRLRDEPSQPRAES